uniref:Uncharacterized protein n=1 Tax=Lactuca sativa TaxID=4236 RepID=A0A9R1UKV2_LACSA|nr:hypothetical protein LSAT_V11C800447170 [Lactuca sativa]
MLFELSSSHVSIFCSSEGIHGPKDTIYEKGVFKIKLQISKDRMTMLAQALEYEKFDKFDRVRVLKIRYACMLQYDGELKLPNDYLVSPP